MQQPSHTTPTSVPEDAPAGSIECSIECPIEGSIECFIECSVPEDAPFDTAARLHDLLLGESAQVPNHAPWSAVHVTPSSLLATPEPSQASMGVEELLREQGCGSQPSGNGPLQAGPAGTQAFLGPQRADMERGASLDESGETKSQSFSDLQSPGTNPMGFLAVPSYLGTVRWDYEVPPPAQAAPTAPATGRVAGAAGTVERSGNLEVARGVNGLYGSRTGIGGPSPAPPATSTAPPHWTQSMLRPASLLPSKGLARPGLPRKWFAAATKAITRPASPRKRFAPPPPSNTRPSSPRPDSPMRTFARRFTGQTFALPPNTPQYTLTPEASLPAITIEQLEEARQQPQQATMLWF